MRSRALASRVTFEVTYTSATWLRKLPSLRQKIGVWSNLPSASIACSHDFPGRLIVADLSNSSRWTCESNVSRSTTYTYGQPTGAPAPRGPIEDAGAPLAAGGASPTLVETPLTQLIPVTFD